MGVFGSLTEDSRGPEPLCSVDPSKHSNEDQGTQKELPTFDLSGIVVDMGAFESRGLGP